MIAFCFSGLKTEQGGKVSKVKDLHFLPGDSWSQPLATPRDDQIQVEDRLERRMLSRGNTVAQNLISGKCFVLKDRSFWWKAGNGEWWGTH